MNPDTIRRLLEELQTGSLGIEDVLDRLRTLPFTESADVLADTHRLLRQGFPEAVYAEGKRETQVLTALRALLHANGAALATRVSEKLAAALQDEFPDGRHDARSELFTIRSLSVSSVAAPVGVVCAGTSDLRVAEEAAGTLEFSGCAVTRVCDVGVAGLHRLLAHLNDLRACSCLIVVAGMEGALPGVIGGLVACPVIAVPTSVGYGTHFNGLSPLLTMLNTCAAGVTVVNVDNGYGAAVAALRILHSRITATA